MPRETETLAQAVQFLFGTFRLFSFFYYYYFLPLFFVVLFGIVHVFVCCIDRHISQNSGAKKENKTRSKNRKIALLRNLFRAVLLLCAAEQRIPYRPFNMKNKHREMVTNGIHLVNCKCDGDYMVHKKWKMTSISRLADIRRYLLSARNQYFMCLKLIRIYFVGGSNVAGRTVPTYSSAKQKHVNLSIYRYKLFMRLQRFSRTALRFRNPVHKRFGVSGFCMFVSPSHPAKKLKFILYHYSFIWLRDSPQNP